MKNQDKPNKNNSTASDIPNIKPRLIWEPEKITRYYEQWTQSYDLLDELFKHKQTFPCITISEHEKNIITEFSNQEDLVFKKADKRVATVILDVEDYIEKANKQKMRIITKKISHNTTQEHMKIITDTIEMFHH